MSKFKELCEEVINDVPEFYPKKIEALARAAMVMEEALNDVKSLDCNEANAEHFSLADEALAEVEKILEA